MTVPRVKRQSAFDVSFPGEANSSDSVTPPSTSTTASGQIIANASGSKRKGVHTSGSRSTTGLENTVCSAYIISWYDCFITANPFL